MEICFDAAVDGAIQEGVSGLAAGMVGGALTQGAMRTGVIPNGYWARLWQAGRPDRLAAMPQVIGRGMLSPHGLVGAGGVGFASAYTGGVTRRSLFQDEAFTDALINAVDDGRSGAIGSIATTSLHPVTWRYWNVRLRQSAANHIQQTRAGNAHHQHNVAQSPELATQEYQPPTNTTTSSGRFAQLRYNRTTAYDRWYNRNLIGGNLRGDFSEYRTANRPNARFTHRELHTMWRPDHQGPGFSHIPTHGPFAPAWNTHNLPVDPRAVNHVDEKNE